MSDDILNRQTDTEETVCNPRQQQSTIRRQFAALGRREKVMIALLFITFGGFLTHYGHLVWLYQDVTSVADELLQQKQTENGLPMVIELVKQTPHNFLRRQNDYTHYNIMLRKEHLFYGTPIAYVSLNGQARTTSQFEDEASATNAPFASSIPFAIEYEYMLENGQWVFKNSWQRHIGE